MPERERELSGYCSLLNHVLLQADLKLYLETNQILHTVPFWLYTQDRHTSTLKVATFVFKVDVMSPTAGNDVPALQHGSLAMCCEAQCVCQSFDQYSFRCVKECSG